MNENTVQETVSTATNAVAATSGMSGKTKTIIAAAVAAAAGLGAGIFFLVHKIRAKKKASVEVSEEK